jgi:hypothetical protein
MTLPLDPSAKIAEYAHPEVLVSTQWLEENLGAPGLVVVESDEDVLLYDVSHIPGAVKIDWHTDLNQPVVRDYLQGAEFAELASRSGIKRDSTVVIYGDASNWWASYAALIDSAQPLALVSAWLSSAVAVAVVGDMEGREVGGLGKAGKLLRLRRGALGML